MTSRTGSIAGTPSVPGSGGANRVNFNDLVSLFAGAQLAALPVTGATCAWCGSALPPIPRSEYTGIEICPPCAAQTSGERFHRVAKAARTVETECTCDCDPLGFCAHCGVALSDGAWNMTLGDLLAEAGLAASGATRCVDCGRPPGWDGEICHDCRDRRKVDDEMFARHGGDV